LQPQRQADFSPAGTAAQGLFVGSSLCARRLLHSTPYNPCQFRRCSTPEELMHVQAMFAAAVIAGFVEFACLCHEAPECRDD